MEGKVKTKKWGVVVGKVKNEGQKSEQVKCSSQKLMIVVVVVAGRAVDWFHDGSSEFGLWI